MSTLKVDTLQTTGGAGLYPAKAWVNFNGTGTVAIRADGNVSSITDHAVGQFSANLTNATQDANGSVGVSHSADVTATNFDIIGALQTSSSAMRIGTFSSSFADRPYNSMNLMR